MWVDSGASLMARPVQNQDGPVMEARRVPGLEELPYQELGDGGGQARAHASGWVALGKMLHSLSFKFLLCEPR